MRRRGRVDALTELVPELDEAWPDALGIRAEDDTIVLQANDGTDRVVRYSLEPEAAGFVLPERAASRGYP